MMNTASPEIIHRLDTSLDNTSRNGRGTVKMSVLEHQQARMLWQEEQLQQPPAQAQQAEPGYFNTSDQLNLFSTLAQAQHFHGLIITDQNLGGLLTPRMESDPVAQSIACCNNFGSTGGDSFAFGACELGNVTGFGIFNAVSRSASCPPGVAAAFAEAASATTKRKETLLPKKLSSSAGRHSFKKRKADKPHNQKEVAEEQSKDNKMEGCMKEEESKAAEQQSKNIATNNNNTTEPSETSKENSRISEVQKPDYIHVRARRGQATDSHSLAERVRREKISERMKYLQDLVPGCNKITGKAGMLDEIINYVQSLQRQVEFLSMKLADVNPRLDLDIDNFSKEIFPVAASESYVIEESSDMNDPTNYQFAPIEQVISCGGQETDKNPLDTDMALRRTLSAPVSMPETLIEPPYFSQIYPYSTWDAELQSLYSLEFQQGKPTVLLSQPCTGLYGGSNIKIEM